MNIIVLVVIVLQQSSDVNTFLLQFCLWNRTWHNTGIIFFMLLQKSMSCLNSKLQFLAAHEGFVRTFSFFSTTIENPGILPTGTILVYYMLNSGAHARIPSSSTLSAQIWAVLHKLVPLLLPPVLICIWANSCSCHESMNTHHIPWVC